MTADTGIARIATHSGQFPQQSEEVEVYPQLTPAFFYELAEHLCEPCRGFMHARRDTVVTEVARRSGDKTSAVPSVSSVWYS